MEADNHPQDEPPQDKQPHQRKAKGLEVKKENTPEKVEGQLEKKNA